MRPFQGASAVTQYSSGWVYYDFYSTFDCAGDVAYSSGIPINTCVPGDIYARPDDDQADEYKPYQSFQVVNVTSKPAAFVDFILADNTAHNSSILWF
ncbi:hypothetical protein EON65_33395 [archaeon]|nr:MAG: hypothetical protein EON65_33395 [archaeon]